MTAVTPTAPSPDRLSPQVLKLALVLMLGAVMVALDSTMVNVALNTLARDFHSSVATIQWVATGYLLALAMVIPATGWAIERFGATPVWLSSITIFIAGSMLCGVAWSSTSLIGFRVLPGLGGGMILPLIQTVLAQAAGTERVARVMAVVGVPAMLGPVLGPVLGGVLVSGSNWRLIFYINVPICIAALLASRRVVFPETRRSGASRLDLLGLSLLAPALAAIVYGLSEAGSSGSFTSSRVLVPAAIGVALLVAFAVHALLMREEPIIDLRLFRARNFGASVAAIFLFSMAMLGTALLLPLYYQQVRGQSTLDAGLLLAPQGLGMGIAFVLAGKLTDRLGARPLILSGLVLTAAAAVVYAHVAAHTSYALLGATSLVGGLGIGSALVPAMAGAYRGLPGDAVARATSSVRIFQQLGGSFGIAILAVVLQRQAAGHTTAASLASAFGHTFWWAAGFAVLALIPTLLLPGPPPRATPAPEPAG